MASLNNIFLVQFLFLNLFILFKPINCCVGNNLNGCDNNNNKCCPGLTCKTTKNGRSICGPYDCVKQGAECDPYGEVCCYGLFCSRNTRKCETCLKLHDTCGNDGNTFKCCDGMECLILKGTKGFCYRRLEIND